MEDVFSRNSLISVTTTSRILCDQRFPTIPRKVLYVRNSGTAGELVTVHFGKDSAAVLNTGITLKNGESYVESNSEGFECWQGQVSAISDAAGGVSVSLMER